MPGETIAREYEMSLLFYFGSPPNLLYAFSERGGGPVKLTGKPLANGTTVFNKFLHPGDRVYFSLYELAPEGGESSPNRPHRLAIRTGNFETPSLFTSGDPTFHRDDFLERPTPVLEPHVSVFAGVVGLLQWLGPEAQDQPHEIVDLRQDQPFNFAGSVIVACEDDPRSVRYFHFDPEMIVGPDEGPGPDDDFGRG